MLLFFQISKVSRFKNFSSVALKGQPETARRSRDNIPSLYELRSALNRPELVSLDSPLHWAGVKAHPNSGVDMKTWDSCVEAGEHLKPEAQRPSIT